MRKTIIKRGACAIFGLAAAANAFAEDFEYQPMIEIGTGYEFQGSAVTLPGSGSVSDYGVDTSRGNVRMLVTVEALNFQNSGSGTRSTIKFVPIYLELDPEAQGDAFGRVVGHDGNLTNVRRAVGALVDTRTDLDSGLLFVRGKIASVEFDRDKGIWDWRGIDAEVGLTHAWSTEDGKTRFEIELSAGAGVGGVELNGFSDVLRALDVAPTVSSAVTVNPHATLDLGFSHGDFRMSLSNRVEQRIDLNAPGMGEYLGNRLDVNSTRFVSALDVEYLLPGDRRYGTWSVYANARYELDTLTLSQVLFDSGDKFQSLLLTAGIRGRF